MGKAKRRNLKQPVNDKFRYMTRESAMDYVIKNMDDKNKVLDTITLFGFTAEDILEAGAEYEDVMALGGIVTE